MSYLLGISLALSSLFLILLVLIQQGRGGGLAGAFGGMGGQSAFGTKAGDLFTKITIGVAAFWILLCVATVKYASSQSSPFGAGLGTQATPAATATGDDKAGTDAGGADKAGSSTTGSSTAAPDKSSSATTPPSPPAKDSGSGGTSGTPAEKD